MKSSLFKVTKNALLNEELWEATHPSGLQVCVIPKNGFSQKTAWVGVKFGSVDIDFHPKLSPGSDYTAPAGTAHFLEHQMFKKPKYDIFEKFAANGANCNAFTSFNATVYFFVATDNFRPNFDALVELVYSPYFTAEFVDTEKKIIAQEIRMYNDMPDQKIFQNLMSALFVKHPVRHAVAGTEETIAAVTPETLNTNHSTFYHPSNTVLFCAGDVDPQEVYAQLDKILPKFPRSPGAVGRIPTTEPDEVAQKEVRCQLQMPRSKILMGFKETGIEPDPRNLCLKDLKASIILHLLFGKVSGFYNKNYRKGLIDDTFSTSFYSHFSFAMSLFGGDTDAPDGLRAAVLKEIRAARKTGFKKSDVERVKKAQIGGVLRGFDSPYKCAWAFVYNKLNDVNSFDMPKMISDITVKDLYARLEEMFDERRFAASIVDAAPKPSAK